MKQDQGSGTQSLRRALTLLRALASGPGAGVSLQDVATTTGLTRPTVHRLLKALIEEGVVEQNARTRRYSVGEQIPMLALARTRQSPLLQAAEPLVAKAAQKIGDTVFLTIRTGDDTLCMRRFMGGYPIQVLVIDVGARRPLGVSSAGLAILSDMPSHESQAVLDRNVMRLGPYRLDRHHVVLAVEEARRRGYARRDPGLVPGTKAVSVVLAKGSRNPTAALTVAAVRARLRPSREDEVVEHLKSVAADIIATLR